ncbi:hypothetical protein [Nonomuraea sp. NPDC049695]|uniref:hypothetical protein n=1 Tax=Nonomuraea sp. NPDC049695 TaxID=3154734 RepID=UPI00344518C1
MKRRTMLVAVAIAVSAGCATSGGPVYDKGVDLATARRVLAERGNLIDREYPRSVGHGVGVVVADPERVGARAYGIVVYLADDSDMPRGPRFVDGVPISFTVTGEFRG